MSSHPSTKGGDAGECCIVCREEACNETVKCDRCRRRFHFKCVGVSQELDGWRCAICWNEEPVFKTNSDGAGTSGLKPIPKFEELLTPVGPGKKKPSADPAKKVTKPKKELKPRPKPTPKPNPKPDPKPNPEPDPKPAPEPIPTPVPDIPKLPPKKAKSLVSHISSASGSTSKAVLKLKLQKLEEQRLLIETQMEKERTLLENERTLLERKYEVLEEKYQLLEEQVAGSDGVESRNGSVTESRFAPPDASSRHSDSSDEPKQSSYANSSSPGEKTGKHHGKTPQPDRTDFPKRDPCPLTTKQLAARQAISKDLPCFNGNPADWPLFISTFNSTTAMCGFTDEENIFRLVKCLKGRALERVQNRLTHPANLPGILRTLKLMYGQPEAIVHSLIGKIHALPVVSADDFEALVDFAVTVENFCATVDSCGLEEHLYNVTLLHQLVNKLPPTIKLNWAQYKLSLPGANLASFSNWIYSLAEAASTIIIPNNPASQPVRNESRSTTKKENAFLNAHSNDTSPEPSNVNKSSKPSEGCLVCKGSCKTIDKCKRFLELSRDSRWAAVREFSLCRSCLRRHAGDCQQKCGKDGCQFRHHKLLHNDQKPFSPGTTSSESPSQLPSTNNSEKPKEESSSTLHGCHTHQTKSSGTLFRYLPVMLSGKRRSVRAYAFLDDGSALTLLDRELADELGLEGEVNPLCLHWTGGTQRQETNSRIVSLEISGTHGGAKSYPISGVRTVNELMLPFQTMDLDELSQLNTHLLGLPIASYHGVRPQILIGLKNLHLSMILNCREGKPDQPIAVKTRLGWTVCGGGNPELVPSPVHSVFHVASGDTDEDLHRTMKDYFALDSLGIMKPGGPLLSTEDQRAQSLQESLTRFTGERYETGLLWRSDKTRLPDSQDMALRRFKCLEKRMEKDEALAETLKQKMTDHLRKGYIRKLTQQELNQSYQRSWYLPVFPVTNPNKPGKVRMVWDAAAKSHGVSLNSALLKGPDLLSSLYTVLILFRENPIALTGDIREMFHQVAIRQEDQQCQRFYWRDENGQLAVYAMCVMTFGACCSPSSAQYVMNLNADRFTREYPTATEVIRNQHYVDDMLFSVNTEAEAIKIAKDVKFVHSKGGFEIRNWVSNSQRVLQALLGDTTEEKNLDLSPEMTTEKVLGMWWCTEADVFTFKIGWDRYDRDLLEGRRRPTKREVLRVLMTIFDPLGLIAPFLVYLKILLQDIWRSGILWDDKINDKSFSKWIIWLRVLPQVERIQIPRCFRLGFPDYDEVQLHTFVDASENAMAATCYLRFVKDGSIRCSQVAGKTRVAPLRYHSIPKLECESAVVGVRLARTVTESLSFTVDKHFYHTDSRDVICWLNSDHRRYSSFIASRISEILEYTEVNQWRWVPTKLNVADDATKWEKLPDMTSSSRWFNGPEFLWLPEEAWPRQLEKGCQTDVELRPSLLAHFTKPDSTIEVSSWKLMLKVAVVVHRFPLNCRRKKAKQPAICGPPTSEELLAAERYVFRQAQREVYADDVAILLRRTEEAITNLSPTSSLYKLSPWLDKHGLLRMRGRISACALVTEDAKNPIILPRDHHTTQLVIEHYHNKYHHQNHETVINELRQRFSIPRLRVVYANVRKNCQRCKNDRATPRPPMMADLPPERLDALARPFTHVGIDYFGPLVVSVGRRTEKRWGMLITCLTTRAIHIEVVHSLSTDSCIMGLRNFSARRGTPRTIYSDRGTCFIGAKREIHEATENIKLEDVMKEFVSVETTWKFNPPLSPHMGGSWERLIGIVKRNLMAIRPVRNPSDEVLRNLLTEIEHTVNSRPLTHVPVDDESAPALTPNHFLLGTSDGSKPTCTLDDDGMVLRRSWRTSQVLANRFWKRWLNDYLPEITRRTKWFCNSKPIEIGDIVVIVDPLLPRNCWPKGKIIGTSISKKDGQIRAATVRTSTGVYERPVAKLAVLDVRRDYV